ncbi:MAG TPA: hypothetical protein VFU95_09610 [Telluria sp.]|nr:hypothetical protein [Telluria sp.]
MEWIPVVLVAFKLLVLGTGMFYAVKWHYDKGRKGLKKEQTRTVLRRGGKVAAVFVVLVVGLIVITLFLSRKLGLDLNMS